MNFIDALSFLDGWEYNNYVNQLYEVNKTNPIVLSVPVKGWFSLANMFCTDAYITTKFQLDQVSYTFSPAILYETGDMFWHPTAPYLTIYQPSVGTAGNFNIENLPDNPIPFRHQMSFTLSLNEKSTQTTAEAEVLITLIQVYDPEVFLRSFKELQTIITPDLSFEISTPYGRQQVTQKPVIKTPNDNTFRCVAQVKTEEQELAGER